MAAGGSFHIMEIGEYLCGKVARTPKAMAASPSAFKAVFTRSSPAAFRSRFESSSGRPAAAHAYWNVEAHNELRGAT